MKKYILVSLCFAQLFCSSTWEQQEKYTIEYEDDGKEKPIAFYFQQQCKINNEQDVTCNYPVAQPEPPEPIDSSSFGWSSFAIDIFTPLKVSAVGAFLYALYYIKTKINLYSLSKACIQTAFWSLWQLKNKNDLIFDQSQDTALLYDILQTYHTDHYAVAISRFMQDVDREIESLHRYINEAADVKASLVQFFLPDMNNDILEAQARLARLMYLKQKVINWLAQEHNKSTQKWS